MSIDIGKIAKKINQLKKRISRDRDNPDHNSELKTKLRKKRLQELQKSFKNDKKSRTSWSK